jgi:hypothetical protein
MRVNGFFVLVTEGGLGSVIVKPQIGKIEAQNLQ